MDFNVERDFYIFDHLFQKRPEISREGLIADLQRYYLSYLEKLINIKHQKNSSQGIIVGVSAIQGAGKTTQGEILEILLDHLGYETVSLSIDDHYLTHEELNKLREKDPRYIRRGVTHDIPLALSNLSKLKNMREGDGVLVAGYDKGANQGDGDRYRWINPGEGIEVKTEIRGDKVHLVSATYKGRELNLPENMGADVSLDKREVAVGWRLITKKPDFIFYDGWMLGARRVKDESVFDSGLPALESTEAKEFAREVNKKLEKYYELWEMFSFLNVLYVPNYQVSIQWRDQAEEVLRAKGEGMSHEQIVEFVHYFWRSVHPAIHIKNLANDIEHTNQVVVIGDDHSIKEVLSPQEIKEKYP